MIVVIDVNALTSLPCNSVILIGINLTFFFLCRVISSSNSSRNVKSTRKIVKFEKLRHHGVAVVLLQCHPYRKFTGVCGT